MTRRKYMATIGGLLLAATCLADDAVSKLKLRAQAVVCGPDITLADVLLFDEADPKLLAAVGDETLVSDVSEGQQVVITHAQIVERLDGLGVNLSRVLVCGALECDIALQRATPVSVATDGEGAPLLRDGQTAHPPGAQTLADRLRVHVEREMDALDGSAELHFERAGQEFLQLTTPPWEFSITSKGREKLGLRAFHVVIRRDGRVQRTAEVFARVRMIRKVVVAHRPLSIGNFIHHDDVGLETRVFDADDEIGIGQIGEVIGQQVKNFVASGGMVKQRDLKAIDLVRRSRPVTVVSDTGNVRVRLTGVAQDSGGYGETVRVRLGNTRETRRVVRGVVTGLGTVELTEENL